MGTRIAVPNDQIEDELPPYRPFPEAWYRWFWRLCILLLLLTGLGFWRGKEWYSAAKVWRARHLIARAEAAEAQADDAKALELLRQAGALLQQHPVLIRAVAGYYARHDDPECLGLFEVLAKAHAATAEDWIAYTRAAFRTGQKAKVIRGMQEVKGFPGISNSPAVLRLDAENALSQGQWADAILMAERAVAALGNATGYDERELLARILLQVPPLYVSDRERARREGIRILGELAKVPDRRGVSALEGLLNAAGEPETAILLRGLDVGPWMQAAAVNPFAKDQLRVRVWELAVAAEPSQRAEIMTRFDAQYKAATGQVRLEAARWLVHHGELERAKAIAQPVKLESEEWFMVYLDSIAGLGDWDQVLNEVDTIAPVPLPAAVRRLFRLRARLELHANPDTVAEWNLIHAAIDARDVKQQMYIASYAEKIGFPQEAAPIYRTLLKTQGRLPITLGVGKIPNAQRLACYLGLVRTSGAAMETKEFAALLATFASEFPDVDEAQNDAAYFGLLLGDGTGDVDAAVGRLMDKHPNMLAYQSTAALLALRRNRPEEALKVYERWQVPWEEAIDRYKVVRVAVLEANGLKEEAGKLRSSIQSDQLRPEEKILAGLN